jgi:hypothetical protein
MEPDSQSPVQPSSCRRWFGPGAIVAMGVFVLGRLALEPLRDAPHFDERGMEAYNATETYLLRKNPTPIKVGLFGSSQSVWALLADDVARDLGEKPEEVRNLAVEGGTPFDTWNLIRRNEAALAHLRLAVIEVNPFVMKVGLDSDPRVSVDIAQHATVGERLMLAHRSDRVKQMAEWALPLLSVRRSLESTFLNVVDPEPGLVIYPRPDQRIYPAVGWKVDHHRHVKKDRITLDPLVAAKRMVGNWRCSKLQDHALRESLAWFSRHHFVVVFHEPPVHPEVMRVMHEHPELEKGHRDFLAYVDSLRPAPVARIDAADPAICGITAEQMADRTHVNELGAHTYSHHIAMRIREVVPDVLRP